MAINKVILLGNVGKEPEIRSFGNGNEVANFSLATSDVWKDKVTHERREKTEWHKIVVYSAGLVNIVKNHVHKGTKLYIEGALQTRKWINKGGEEGYATEIVLQGFSANLQVLTPRQANSTSKNDEIVNIEENEKGDDKIDDEIAF
jgi:single-strand DNA-binding protein